MNEEQKNHIKDAALKLFETKGYHETKIVEIAEKAGISVGTFYKYYPGKKELFENLARPELLNIQPAFEEERYKIILKGSEIFAELGYKETTMDGIAYQCGFSKATLYKYFPNKDELFNAIVRETHVDLNYRNTLGETSSDIDEVLTGFATHFIEMMSEQHRINLIKMGIKEAKRFPADSDNLLNSQIENTRRALAAYLTEQIKDGATTCADPYSAACYFINTLFSYIITERLVPYSKCGMNAREYIGLHVGIFLKGINEPIPSAKTL